MTVPVVAWLVVIVVAFFLLPRLVAWAARTDSVIGGARLPHIVVHAPMPLVKPARGEGTRQVWFTGAEAGALARLVMRALEHHGHGAVPYDDGINRAALEAVAGKLGTMLGGNRGTT